MRAAWWRYVFRFAELAVWAVLVALAVCIVLTAVMRHFDALHWGLWVSAAGLQLGSVDDPTQARELLGDRIYPIAALTVLVGAFAIQESWQRAQAGQGDASWLRDRRCEK